MYNVNYKIRIMLKEINKMFDNKKYQELVTERVNTDWEYKIDEICNCVRFI